MFAMSLDKMVDKLTRKTQKFDSWRRKHYRKARFLKASARFERFCDTEEAKYANF